MSFFSIEKSNFLSLHSKITQQTFYTGFVFSRARFLLKPFCTTPCVHSQQNCWFCICDRLFCIRISWFWKIDCRFCFVFQHVFENKLFVLRYVFFFYRFHPGHTICDITFHFMFFQLHFIYYDAMNIIINLHGHILVQQKDIS